MRAGRRWVLVAIYVVLAFLVTALPAYADGDHSDDRYPNVVRPSVEFGEYGSGAGNLIDPLGVAFDDENSIFVTDCGNSRVHRFDISGRAVRSWGETGTALGQFHCAYGIAVGPEGHVYVTDFGNDRIQVFDRTGLMLFAWGSSGAAPGHFDRPTAVAVGRTRLMVVDSGNFRVQIFDREGRFVRACGGQGTGRGKFVTPYGVAADGNDNFYVTDLALNRVQKFDVRCRLLRAWGRYGSFSGQLAEPTGIAYHRGKVVVTDAVNHRIQVFTARGAYKVQWGRHPRREHEGQGRVHYPYAVAVSPSGTYSVVCEPFENRCQVFRMAEIRTLRPLNDSAWWWKNQRFHYGTGVKVMANRNGLYLGLVEPDTHYTVIFDIKNGPRPRKTAKFGGFGSGPERLNQPEGIASDARGNVYVSDRGNNRIQVFSLSGEYRRTIGSFGRTLGKLNSPGKLDFDRLGRLYVLDAGNNRIQVFNAAAGRALRAWGSKGSRRGQFDHPEGLCVDAKRGLVYVVDTGNFRIQAFTTAGVYRRSWGRPGTAPDEFLWPYGITCGQDGHIYVTDASQQRVKKFDRNGKLVKQWGRYGSKEGEFYKPKGIAQDPRGFLYVVDFGNHRGQIFSADGRFVRIFGEGELHPPEPPGVHYTRIVSLGGAALGSLGLLALYVRRRRNGKAA
jgi:tripartite motif-containing protein 71